MDSVDPIAKGIEGHDVMDYTLEPNDPVILLFHVFGYDIVNNEFEKVSKIEFEFKNETKEHILQQKKRLQFNFCYDKKEKMYCLYLYKVQHIYWCKC